MAAASMDPQKRRESSSVDVPCEEPEMSQCETDLLAFTSESINEQGASSFEGPEITSIKEEVDTADRKHTKIAKQEVNGFATPLEIRKDAIYTPETAASSKHTISGSTTLLVTSKETVDTTQVTALNKQAVESGFTTPAQISIEAVGTVSENTALSKQSASGFSDEKVYSTTAERKSSEIAVIEYYSINSNEQENSETGECGLKGRSNSQYIDTLERRVNFNVQDTHRYIGKGRSEHKHQQKKLGLYVPLICLLILSLGVVYIIASTASAKATELERILSVLEARGLGEQAQVQMGQLEHGVDELNTASGTSLTMLRSVLSLVNSVNFSEHTAYNELQIVNNLTTLVSTLQSSLDTLTTRVNSPVNFYQGCIQETETGTIFLIMKDSQGVCDTPWVAINSPGYRTSEMRCICDPNYHYFEASVLIYDTSGNVRCSCLTTNIHWNTTQGTGHDYLPVELATTCTLIVTRCANTINLP